MSDLVRRRVVLEIPWRTLLKLMLAVALAWTWLQVWELVLLLLVAILLAVTLDPVVRRVQRWGLPRWGASTAVCFVLLVAIVGFLWLTWSSLSDQAHDIMGRLPHFEQQVSDRIPSVLKQAGDSKGGGNTAQSMLLPYAGRLARAAGNAIVVFVLAFILTLYLLIEGHRTYKWAIAFVPESWRGRVEQTLAESQEMIFGYVAGNVATSVFATIFVFVALTILKVPAALLLAVIAGVCDFIPVLGFIASALPAILLALTVSGTTALVTAICYLAYHAIENYFIAPRVYGEQLELSNVAVVLAFAVGAAIAGVVGAAIALPLAAVYPAVERIWLRDRLPKDTVKVHERLADRKAG